MVLTYNYVKLNYLKCLHKHNHSKAEHFTKWMIYICQLFRKLKTWADISVSR